MPAFVQGLPQPQPWLAVGTGVFLGGQLFSAPLLGRLSDGYGRRPVFILSALGALLVNMLLPVRASVYFANRVSDGPTNGLYAAARSAITPPDQLLRNQGLEGASVSLGFYGLAALDCATLSLVPGLLEGRLAWHTQAADRGELLVSTKPFSR